MNEVNGYICMGSLTPLEDSRSVSTVRCPLCGSIYSKQYSGQVCLQCDLCTLGEEALGLKIVLDQ